MNIVNLLSWSGDDWTNISSPPSIQIYQVENTNLPAMYNVKFLTFYYL